MVADYSGGRIREYNEAGEQLWSIEASNPFACMGLPNGHRLVSHYSANKVVEYDADGEVYKEFTDLPSSISGVDRTEDGHTFIAAGQGGNKVIELDPEGNKILDLTVEGNPTSVKMLANGNLLLALYGENKIVEINREGERLHEVDIDSGPYFANQLENGNYLVACASGSKVYEYTFEGELVWEVQGDGNLYHAQRHGDGTTTFADQSGIHHIDMNEEVVSELDGEFGDYIYVYRF